MKRRAKSGSGIAADRIRKAIQSGELKPGDRLESIRALAEKFGVGRQVVLSAFQLLAEEGLLVSRVGCGTVVNPALEHEKKCRLAFLLMYDDLDNPFYQSVYRGIMRQVSQTDGQCDLEFFEQATLKDIRRAAKRNDVLLLTGRIENQTVRIARAAGKPYMILGNYILADERNMCRLELRSRMVKAFEYAARDGEGFGIIWGPLHLSSTQEVIMLAERFCAEHDLPWSGDSIVCVNSVYGREEIEFYWGTEHRWPKHLVTTWHTHIGFMQFLTEHHVPEEEWPEIILCLDGMTPPSPLPYSKIRIKLIQGSSSNFGGAAVELAVRFASGRIRDGFRATYDPNEQRFEIIENK